MDGPYRTDAREQGAPLPLRRPWLLFLSHLLIAAAAGSLVFFLDKESPSLFVVGVVLAGVCGGAAVFLSRVTEYGDPKFWFRRSTQLSAENAELKHENRALKADFERLKDQERRRQALKQLGRKSGMSQEDLDSMMAQFRKDMDLVREDAAAMLAEGTARIGVMRKTSAPRKK